MSDCTCGFGGFHEELNTRCALYVAPSPYRFTVSVERDTIGVWCIFIIDNSPEQHVGDAADLMFVAEFATEAEARSHAAQVLAALHQATMEETP